MVNSLCDPHRCLTPIGACAHPPISGNARALFVRHNCTAHSEAAKCLCLFPPRDHTRTGRLPLRWGTRGASLDPRNQSAGSGGHPIPAPSRTHPASYLTMCREATHLVRQQSTDAPLPGRTPEPPHRTSPYGLAPIRAALPIRLARGPREQATPPQPSSRPVEFSTGLPGLLSLRLMRLQGRVGRSRTSPYLELPLTGNLGCSPTAPRTG